MVYVLPAGRRAECVRRPRVILNEICRKNRNEETRDDPQAQYRQARRLSDPPPQASPDPLRAIVTTFAETLMSAGTDACAAPHVRLARPPSEENVLSTGSLYTPGRTDAMTFASFSDRVDDGTPATALDIAGQAIRDFNAAPAGRRAVLAGGVVVGTGEAADGASRCRCLHSFRTAALPAAVRPDA